MGVSPLPAAPYPDPSMSYLSFIRANLPFLSAGFLLTFSSTFGQTVFISVFGGEIRTEFGLSNGAWGTIYAVGTLGSAAMMLWAGTLTDRFRARSLGRTALLFLTAAALIMAAAPGAWALVLGIFALRLAGQGMMIHIAQVAMARWFARSRGRALSLASLGLAAGEAALPVAFVAGLSVGSWRLMWLIAALIPLALMPILSRLLRLERTPQSLAAESASLGMEGRHWRRGEMLRHWLFWMIAPQFLGPAMFSTAFFFHQVPLAEAKGWAHVELVALFPFWTASAVVSMLGSGPLIDRIGAGRLLPLAMLPIALGFLVVGASPALALAAIGLILIGMTQGMMATLTGAFWAEFYGTAHIGAIRAVAAALMVLGTAIGPVLTGSLIDSGLAFTAQMPAIAGYFLLTSLLTMIATRRARPLLAAA